MERASYVANIMPHLRVLKITASAMVGVADAEDAVQEALLRAWHAWPELRDTAAVRSWLLRITFNVCRDWRRGHFGTHRQRTEPLTEATLGLISLWGEPGSSDHTGMLDLRQAIIALPEPMRQVVVLRYYVGLDATEISAILDIPAGTVRSRLHRALTLLREHLQSSDTHFSTLHSSQEDSHV